MLGLLQELLYCLNSVDADNVDDDDDDVQTNLSQKVFFILAVY